MSVVSKGHWPFASADSTNVARNFKSAKRDPVEMARAIDAKQPRIRAMEGYQNRKSDPDAIEDFPTPPWATRAFLAHIMPDGPAPDLTCWEPAANRGHMVRPLQEYFGTVIGSDIADYGAGFPVIDFLSGPTPRDFGMPVDWIITNPPFNKAEEFVLRALDIAEDGVAIFQRQSFMEGKGRYERIFRPFPPTIIAPYVERVTCLQGRIDRATGSQMPYAWFVWTKQATYDSPWAWPPAGSDTKVKWIPPCRKKFEKESDYE